MLGGLIGLEREYKRKEAGLRTFSLVCLGSTLFTMVSLETFFLLSESKNIAFDPSRIIQAIAVGIGFIGGGLIIYRRFKIEGLTTAAGLWVTSAIGIAIGARLYFIAFTTSLLTIAILAILKSLERKVFDRKDEKQNL